MNVLQQMREYRRRLGARSAVLRNASWLLGDRLVRMLVAVVVTTLVARYLGPERLGALNYAVAWVGLFTSLTGLGLDNIVVRDLVRSPDTHGTTLGTALWLRLAAGTTASLLAPLLALAISSPKGTVLLIALVTPCSALAASESFALWFQARSRMQSIVLGRIAGFGVASVLRLVLIARGAPLHWFALSYSIDAAVTAAALWATFVLRGGATDRLRYVASRARALLSESWPLYLSAITIMVYLRVDQVLLPLLADEHEAGIYAVAVRISELWYVVPVTLVSAALPSVIALERNGQTAFMSALGRLFRSLVALGYVVGGIVTVASPWVVRILFGDQYAAAAPVLAVHVWSGVFVALGTARSLWNTSTGATRLAFYSTAGGAIVNVVLNVALVPRFGAMGSAVATLIAYAYAGVLAYLVHPSGRPVGVSMMRALVLR